MRPRVIFFDLDDTAEVALDELEEHWRDLVPSLTVGRSDAARVLRALRSDALRVGVVTNGPTAVQRLKLRLAGLWDLVDTFVTSEMVGAAKPSAAIFLQAVEATGTRAEACLLVGDHWTKDVEGAAQAGLQPVWFRTRANRDQHAEVDYPEVTSLTQVCAIAREFEQNREETGCLT